MVASLRMLAASSRSLTVTAARSSVSTPSLHVARSLHASSTLGKEPESDPKSLHEKSAKKAKDDFAQDNPDATMSEEASKADVDGHDPLPDEKKKKNSKPEQ